MSIANWCWVVFGFSTGARHLNFNNKTLVYGNEAILPFYIFHQTIILTVGWFVIRWNLGILPKYLIISVVSFALVMALYELLVRHKNIVRFFFGMRPKKRPAPHRIRYIEPGLIKRGISTRVVQSLVGLDRPTISKIC